VYELIYGPITKVIDTVEEQGGSQERLHAETI